jgi:trimeric autotransporter adhesin
VRNQPMRLAPGIAIVFGNAAPSIRAIIVKQRAMWKRTLFCLAACFSVGVLQAQTYPLPPGTVGVPYSIDFGQGLSEVASEFAAAGLDASFTYNFAVSGGGLAPGLSMSASGLLSGTPTTPGPYTFTVTFTFTISIEGFAQSGSFPYTLSLDVTGNAGPAVAVSPGNLSFSLSQGSTTPLTQSIVIANTGSVAESFTASAATNSGGNWLSLSQGSGSVASFSSGSVSVSANPSGLAAGTYLGSVSVSVSPASQQFSVPVIATVSGGQAQLRLSQTGYRFQTVAGGANPPGQALTVLNSGSGSLKFSASSSTTSGGDWLSVSPASGTVTSSAPAVATVSIQSSGIAAGDYYGQVQISADGAANSPQTASVVLNVAQAGTDLGAFIYPTGLIFVAQAGGTNPASQTIAVTNPSTSTLTFSSASFFGQGTNLFTVQPASGTVNSTTPIQLTVQPTITSAIPGIYLGEIVLNFVEDQTSHHIAVLIIVLPAGPSASTAHALTAGCTPTKLLPVFTELGANFSTVAAWPTPIQVAIVDDCGNFMTAGNVTASFSDSDPSLPLTSLDNGIWSATWQPRSSASQVVITVDAAEIVPPLEGTQSIGGALQANPTTPSVYSGGVVSAAKYSQNQPLSLGGFTSIYGVHLSAGQNLAPSLPLATQLGATQVTLGGRPLPLQYAGDGQVNAVIPYDVPPNTTQQLIVTNGPALSVPEPVVIAPAQPAVFANADGSGIVNDFKPGSSVGVPVDAAHPISAGDAIVISCTGLGPVNPPVVAGAAAPSAHPATTTNQTTVTIGGKPAQVFFSGLVGGFAGLYQVNAYVPKGITPGDAVPLIITVAGFESAPVTVAVK